VYHQSSTYPKCGVALEGTGVDLDICAIISKDCSALLSWMSGPRDIEKFQERSAEHHASTYGISAVGVEGRVMDDKSSIFNVDGSSALEVVCGPPGHREISGTFCRPSLIHLRNKRCWCRRSSHGRPEFHPQCRWLPRTESCMWGPRT
jgi:hypothetical protein